MSWWVLTWYQQIRDYENLRVWSQTDQTAHLLMKWAHIKPSRTPINRVLRGKIVFCGYRYKWDSPNLAEQIEFGDTRHHTFHLPDIDPSRYVWYYLFSPIGPYGLEVQSPLMVSPPLIPRLWTTTAYVGTRSKGVFFTRNFTGPGGPQPTWKPLNAGLVSLHCWQLHADPLGVEHRQYAITGESPARILYRRFPYTSYAWQNILSTPAAEAITGGSNGCLRWVASSINRPAYLYVLFTCDFPPTAAFLLRSPDYGDSWTAHPIYAEGDIYEGGNLEIGILQGTSPYPAGDLLYAVLHAYPEGYSMVWRSFNNGATWTYGDHNSLPYHVARLLVDPTDQSVSYLGGYGTMAVPRTLWRSTDHADNYANITPGLSLGTFVDPHRANAWIDPTDRHFIRILQDHIFSTSTDFGASWTRHGTTFPGCQLHTALWEQPTNLYLARDSSPPPYPFPQGTHVVFVSNDEGYTQVGKSGEHAWHPDGQGDSIPWDCGGVCHDGIQLYPPF